MTTGDQHHEWTLSRYYSLVLENDFVRQGIVD